MRDGLIALIGLSMVFRMGSIRMQQLTCSPQDLSTAPAKPKSTPLREWRMQLKQVFERRNLVA